MREEEKKETEVNKEDEEGFKEVLNRRKPQKGAFPLKPLVKIVISENQNKFGVLQEEEMETKREDREEEPAELSKREKGQEPMQTSLEQEKEGESIGMPQDQTQMEIDPQKNKGSKEEQVMRRILHGWRHLDERFMPDEQNQLYKDMFKKYK